MRVMVTGGNGFLGRYVVRELEANGHDVFAPSSKEYDLTTDDGLAQVFREPVDGLIHLAAVVGGIGANGDHPGRFFYENALMGIRLIDTATAHSIKKVLTVGTACSYPAFGPIPQMEEDFWHGYPARATAPYAMAKKMLLVQQQAYRKEYGLHAAYVILANLYGPGDNFDLATGHVVPSVIRKVQLARDEKRYEAIMWGTGMATRDFLYVEDAARGIRLAFENYDEPDPLNLGSGVEVPVYGLVDTVTMLMGYSGVITWDHSRPDGQLRRCLDITKAKDRLDWEPLVDLEEGLSRTIEWWKLQPK